MTDTVPFILDTDTAQDDCVAMLFGLLDPKADLRAVTMVAGNIGFDRQVENAAMTMNVAGRLGEVPIHLGCTQPMLREWVSAEEVHGDGSGGLKMEMPQDVISEQHGVDALLEITAKDPGKVSVVAIGPLTNIAMAVAKDREFVRNVKSLYIMGGSNNGRGNTTSAAEFNFYVDPEAAQIVMDAGFADIHIIDWDPVTLRDATYTRDEYHRMCQAGESNRTPLASFFQSVCDATLDFNESVGVDGSTHPDSMTAACLLHPELMLEVGNYRVDVECKSELTRGYSAMAWDKFDIVPNAVVVERADKEAFREMLTELLRQETKPNVPMLGL